MRRSLSHECSRRGRAKGTKQAPCPKIAFSKERFSSREGCSMKLTVADFCPGSGDATVTRLTGSSVVETGVFEVDGSSAMPGSSNCRDSSAFEPDARTAFASPAGFANPLLTENASPESDPGPWMLRRSCRNHQPSWNRRGAPMSSFQFVIFWCIRDCRILRSPLSQLSLQ